MADSSKKTEFSFAALSKVPAGDPEDVMREQDNRAHWAARKACSTLKITSAIISAIVVHPGASGTEIEIEAAASELKKRAMTLTQTALQIAGVTQGARHYAAFKNRMLQQVADAVATQWRMEHSIGAESLSVERVAKIFESVMRTNPIDDDIEDLPYPDGINPVLAKRLSLLAVMPGIADAINAFDYFSPSSDPLTRDGLREVLQASEDGLERLMGEGVRSEDRTMVMQSMIGRMGDLYAANYRAIARKDVLQLQRMEESTRTRLVLEAKASGQGMATEHVNKAFREMAERLVQMVCAAVPEVRVTAAPFATAQEESPGTGEAGVQRMEIS